MKLLTLLESKGSVLAEIGNEIRTLLNDKFPEGHAAINNAVDKIAISDHVRVFFTPLNKEAWPNGISRNAPHIIALISEAGRRWELGTGPYQFKLLCNRDLPRLISKTGTKEQVMRHFERWVSKVEEERAIAQ